MHAQAILASQYLEMRGKILELAADFDRIYRSPGGPALAGSDPRFAELTQAVQCLVCPGTDRALQVQLLLSLPVAS